MTILIYDNVSCLMTIQWWVGKCNTLNKKDRSVGLEFDSDNDNLTVIMAKNMIVSLLVIVFITAVFAGSSLLLHIASICIILRHIGLQLQRLSYNHQLLCRNVALKTSYAIYHFRVKMAETIKMAEDQLFIS